MKSPTHTYRFLPFFLAVFVALAIGGCAFNEDLDTLLYPKTVKSNTSDFGQANDYYNKFYDVMSHRAQIREGTSDIK
ncbi:MAG: hypothetical protein Q8P48_06380, partial [Deltaproteobacteria bacterium]|nr:hypothetical protein [Deltaproteobacteria bacterium]